MKTPLVSTDLSEFYKHISLGISDSAVSHAGKRAKNQIDQDAKLKNKIRKIERRLKNSIFKT